MNKKVIILIGVSVVVALAIGFFAGTLEIENKDNSKANKNGWNVYHNNNLGFSVEYPNNFSVREKNNGYFRMTILDPSSREYFGISAWTWSGLPQDIQKDIDSMFVGPYPKTTSGSEMACPHTIIERVIGGVAGVESFGCSSEGRTYDDTFIFKKKSVLFNIVLNPFHEGHITLDEVEVSQNLDTDKEVYNHILNSFVLQ